MHPQSHRGWEGKAEAAKVRNMETHVPIDMYDIDACIKYMYDMIVYVNR